MKMKASDKRSNPRHIRHRLGLNQQEFWGRIGVTQSGGSRYESGRTMPKPVQELLRLVHVDQIDVHKITRGDFQVISTRSLPSPELYKRAPKRLRANPSATPAGARSPRLPVRPAASIALALRIQCLRPRAGCLARVAAAHRLLGWHLPFAEARRLVDTTVCGGHPGRE